MKKYISLWLLTFLLFGCSQQSEVADVDNSKKTPEQQTVNSLVEFLPKNGTTYFFEGEGNEFAGYTVKTLAIDDTHIAQIEDNGGVQQLKVYRITNTSIDLISKQVIDKTAVIPSASKVKSYKKIETLLQLPLKAGHSFEGWNTISISEKMNLGWGPLDQIIVIEKVDNTLLTRKYFAKGYGLIKSEYIIENEGEDPFIVTSTLKSLN
ncbi:MAG: hypothetical protein RR651_07930 [Lysinibacillus sp.]